MHAGRSRFNLIALGTESTDPEDARALAAGPTEVVRCEVCGRDDIEITMMRHHVASHLLLYNLTGRSSRRQSRRTLAGCVESVQPLASTSRTQASRLAAPCRLKKWCLPACIPPVQALGAGTKVQLGVCRQQHNKSTEHKLTAAVPCNRLHSGGVVL